MEGGEGGRGKRDGRRGEGMEELTEKANSPAESYMPQEYMRESVWQMVSVLSTCNMHAKHKQILKQSKYHMRTHTLVPVMGHCPELASVAAITAPRSQSTSTEHSYTWTSIGIGRGYKMTTPTALLWCTVSALLLYLYSSGEPAVGPVIQCHHHNSELTSLSFM